MPGRSPLVWSTSHREYEPALPRPQRHHRAASRHLLRQLALISCCRSTLSITDAFVMKPRTRGPVTAFRRDDPILGSLSLPATAYGSQSWHEACTGTTSRSACVECQLGQGPRCRQSTGRGPPHPHTHSSTPCACAVQHGHRSSTWLRRQTDDPMLASPPCQGWQDRRAHLPPRPRPAVMASGRIRDFACRRAAICWDYGIDPTTSFPPASVRGIREGCERLYLHAPEPSTHTTTRLIDAPTTPLTRTHRSLTDHLRSHCFTRPCRASCHAVRMR